MSQTPPALTPDSDRRRYACRRVAAPLPVDGSLDHPAWQALPWTADFIDITGDPAKRPRFRTRAKMGWDDDYFYVGAELEEPHVWGTLREKNSVIFHDNDFEVFIDPDGDGLGYYEFEINALGTIWELSLPKPYGQGGVPVLGCNLPGLRSAVRARGTLNDPRDTDDGWSVTAAFPWGGLARYNPGRRTPPAHGDTWRINFSRVQWRHEISDGTYVRVPPHGTPVAESLNPEEQAHPEDNWVWSPQGAVNMHLPHRWGEVVFEGPLNPPP
jgi:hypothetical protein